MSDPTPSGPTPSSIAALLGEYDAARAYTLGLYDGLVEAEVVWRPSEASSAIGWHLGHQAVVNHFMVRNLVAAEASPDPALDALFDSATPEAERAALPSLGRIVAYREAVAERTRTRVEAVLRGDVGAPAQLGHIAAVLLTGLVNHEYQHDCWIGEMRVAQGHPGAGRPPSGNVVEIDGYWILRP